MYDVDDRRGQGVHGDPVSVGDVAWEVAEGLGRLDQGWEPLVSFLDTGGRNGARDLAESEDAGLDPGLLACGVQDAFCDVL